MAEHDLLDIDWAAVFGDGTAPASDYALARQLGCGKSTVRRWRLAYDIPAYTEERLPRGIDWDSVDWSENNNSAIARELGVSSQAVAVARARASR